LNLERAVSFVAKAELAIVAYEHWKEESPAIKEWIEDIEGRTREVFGSALVGEGVWREPVTAHTVSVDALIDGARQLIEMGAHFSHLIKDREPNE